MEGDNMYIHMYIRVYVYVYIYVYTHTYISPKCIYLFKEIKRQSLLFFLHVSKFKQRPLLHNIATTSTPQEDSRLATQYLQVDILAAVVSEMLKQFKSKTCSRQVGQPVFLDFSAFVQHRLAPKE